MTVNCNLLVRSNFCDLGCVEYLYMAIIAQSAGAEEYTGCTSTNE